MPTTSLAYELGCSSKRHGRGVGARLERQRGEARREARRTPEHLLLAQRDPRQSNERRSAADRRLNAHCSAMTLAQRHECCAIGKAQAGIDSWILSPHAA
eukprot:168310-Pleurochrysis_carterae.AAC.1